MRLWDGTVGGGVESLLEKVKCQEEEVVGPEEEEQQQPATGTEVPQDAEADGKGSPLVGRVDPRLQTRTPPGRS